MKRKPLSLTKLAVKAEHLQRDYFFKLYGKLCEICNEEAANCLDHCFSRAVKQLFFEKSNLTRIGPKCHFLKSKKINGMDLKVFSIVKEREGADKFHQMWQIAEKHAPFEGWNRNYLNQKIETFKKLLEA